VGGKGRLKRKTFGKKVARKHKKRHLIGDGEEGGGHSMCEELEETFPGRRGEPIRGGIHQQKTHKTREPSLPKMREVTKKKKKGGNTESQRKKRESFSTTYSWAREETLCALGRRITKTKAYIPTF